MPNLLKLGLLMMICLAISGCPLAYILSDRLVYKFQGTIFSPLNQQRLSSVSVRSSCEKTRLDPPHETLSDNNGSYTLQGYLSGPLDDCELSFEHPQFKRKVVKLHPDRRDQKAETGFIRVWTIDVELEPN